jgi:hypothetical protein
MRTIVKKIVAGTTAAVVSGAMALFASFPAFAGTTYVEDNDPTVVYTGVWYTASMSTLSGGSAHESNTIGSTASLVFTGTGVTWISYLCTCTSGISNVYVDGQFKASVDTYGPSPQPQAPVFSISNLSPGTHVLTIEVTGQYDPRGQTAYVVVDGFEVTQ